MKQYQIVSLGSTFEKKKEVIVYVHLFKRDNLKLTNLSLNSKIVYVYLFKRTNNIILIILFKVKSNNMFVTT